MRGGFMSLHQSIDTTMYEWWIQVGTVKIGQQHTVEIGQQNNKLLFFGPVEMSLSLLGYAERNSTSKMKE